MLSRQSCEWQQQSRRICAHERSRLKDTTDGQEALNPALIWPGLQRTSFGQQWKRRMVVRFLASPPCFFWTPELLGIYGPGDDEVEALADLEELIVLLVCVVDQPRLRRRSARKTKEAAKTRLGLAAHSRRDHAVGERDGVIACSCSSGCWFAALRVVQLRSSTIPTHAQR